MIEWGIIIALFCLFVHACTWEGMIGEKIGELFWEAPVWIKKPLFSCPICMCPWWGSGLIVLFGILTDYWPHPVVWFLELAIAGGINVVLSSIIHPHEQEPTDEG